MFTVRDLTDSKLRDLTTSLSKPQNNFIEEDDPVLDEKQHFVEMSLGILIFGSGILIFGDIDFQFRDQSDNFLLSL